MNELQKILAERGYSERPAQTRLFEHLISATNKGVVAQAGTGTGKSMAILAAAANRARRLGAQSIVVTPTLTLMNQYQEDTRWAAQALPDLAFAELRGRAHYHCEQTRAAVEMMSGAIYEGGCKGADVGCSRSAWLGDEDTPEGERDYYCEYQAAKEKAIEADVVVTNADMLIVNDKILLPLEANIFDMEGALFVDEAHTLEQKFRDYASRSLHWSTIERFKFAPAAATTAIVKWLKRDDGGKALRAPDVPVLGHLRTIAEARLPEPHAKDGLERQRETVEACGRIVAFLEDPHDHAVLHVNQGSLKWDWVNIAKSSGELLSARPFGLVSATVPRTMASCLGVPEAPFVDVGHPFSYGEQAWLGFSAYGGDYRSAQHDSNFDQRVSEVEALIERAGGGALLLFSSFADLERVHDRLGPALRRKGLLTLRQERDMEPSARQGLADAFKADGNAVLFGSESFATGFDVPGNALRLVVIWKLPYPAVDPVSNAIRASSYQRYDDLMKVRAVQGIGRLIRTESDKGIVWIADNRGRRLLDHSDPLTSHIPQFARL